MPSYPYAGAPAAALVSPPPGVGLRGASDVTAAAYTLPTDAPEADGTLAWDSVTLVLAHDSKVLWGNVDGKCTPHYLTVGLR